MEYIAFRMTDGGYICHHGVKGQKWGKRRYQNEDGSLINPKKGVNPRIVQSHGLLIKGRNSKGQKGYAILSKRGDGTGHMLSKEDAKSLKKTARKRNRREFASTLHSVAGTASMLSSIGSAITKNYRLAGISAIGSIANFGMAKLYAKSAKKHNNIYSHKYVNMQDKYAKKKKSRVRL